MQALPPGQTIDFGTPEVDLAVRQWAETRNLLEIAALILQSAAFRTESRGGHYRSDYPETDPDWQMHTLVQADRWWKSPVHTYRNAS
jgi:L-aspartate oxidase